MTAARPGRRRTASAITVVLAAALTGCASSVKATAGPSGSVSAPGPASAAASATPSASASASAPASARATGGAVPVALNGTGSSRLTISNGTSKVVMNGTTVDFGTVVRDLAWNPTGSKAVFIDGNGNLETSNPDGSGRVLVARAPSGENWSHPTWSVVTYDKTYGVAAGSTIVFAASKGGVLRLKSIASSRTDGTPALLTISDTENQQPNPQTGNTWPNGGGSKSAVAYANAANGQVYIRDDYLRPATGSIGAGSEPAVSPDGASVAFVRSVDGHDHLFAEKWGGPARDLTPHAATDYTEPAWSPDGRTLAVRVADGVATLPADGSAAPVRISSVAGLPAYRG